MQTVTGIRRLLSSPALYALVQNLIGARRSRRWLAEHFWQITPDSKVVDIGCGPADVLEFLPADIDYLGFDPSPAYIARARERHGANRRAQFLTGTTATLADDTRFRNADAVLCIGVLHHLEDAEALEVMAFAQRNLRPGGRLLCLEPCFLEKGSRLANWVMRWDRGRNIRAEAAWRALLAAVFPDGEAEPVRGLVRIPYTHILLRGRR